jgi:ribonuclease P protein component
MPEVRTLRKREEFVRLKAEGQRFSTAAFVLQYLENPQESGIAVGYTASTKGVGNAVMRNRARRRLKACFDKLFRLNAGAAGQAKMLAWIAKESILTIDYKRLEDDMRRALVAAGLRLG